MVYGGMSSALSNHKGKGKGASTTSRLPLKWAASAGESNMFKGK
jgi:hypothetical protein